MDVGKCKFSITIIYFIYLFLLFFCFIFCFVFSFVLFFVLFLFCFVFISFSFVLVFSSVGVVQESGWRAGSGVGVPLGGVGGVGGLGGGEEMGMNSMKNIIIQPELSSQRIRYHNNKLKIIRKKHLILYYSEPMKKSSSAGTIGQRPH